MNAELDTNSTNFRGNAESRFGLWPVACNPASEVAFLDQNRLIFLGTWA
jgi:hypothetical protein